MLYKTNIRNLLILFSIFYIFLIFYAFIHTFPPLDEGMHLYNALRISRGELIYQDFYSYLTPLTYYIGAALNYIIKDDFLIPRVLNLITTLLSVPLFIQYSKSFDAHNHEELLLTLLYLACILPASLVFSHHSIANFLFLVLLVICTRTDQLIINEADYQILKPVTVGVVVTLIAMTHQSHGFYVFLGLAIFLIIKKKWLFFKIYTLTVVCIFLAFFISLYLSDRLNNFYYGAIYWNIEVYRKYLSYSPISEQLYLFKTLPLISVTLLESILVFFLKLLLLGLLIFIFIKRKGISDVILISTVLIVSYFLGNVQTANSISSYQILGVSIPILWWLLSKKRIFYMIILTLMCVQLARVTTYPYRIALKYHQNGICHINGLSLICSSEVRSLIELQKYIVQNNIPIAAVIGRSPSLYGFLDIKNYTMHDLIYPIFTEADKLDTILISLGDKYVITDFTDNIIKSSITHSEVMAYHPRLDNFLSWRGYDLIKNGMIYRNEYFGIARLSSFKDH